MCLRQNHAAHELHSDAIHRPGHSSGQLAAVFVLRLNVPNVFALIPQFIILRSNKERALYDSNLFSFFSFAKNSGAQYAICVRRNRESYFFARHANPRFSLLMANLSTRVAGVAEAVVHWSYFSTVA